MAYKRYRPFSRKNHTIDKQTTCVLKYASLFGLYLIGTILILSGGYYFFVRAELSKTSCELQNNVIDYRNIYGIYSNVEEMINYSIEKHNYYNHANKTTNNYPPYMVTPPVITICFYIEDIEKLKGIIMFVFGAIMQFISILLLISIKAEK